MNWNCVIHPEIDHHIPSGVCNLRRITKADVDKSIVEMLDTRKLSFFERKPIQRQFTNTNYSEDVKKLKADLQEF